MMKPPTLQLAVCLDRHMLQAAAVLLTSVKAHATSDRPVRVFVLTNHPGPEFRDLATTMNDARFSLEPLICADVGEELPVRDYLTRALYMRFQLPALLPAVERILYLDVDVVVNRSLAALYDTDLRGLSTAAVPDWPMVAGAATWPTFRIPYDGRLYRFDAYAREVVGLAPSQATLYFNTGVLLLDLALWRRNDLAARTLAWLSGAGSLYFPDQDALNAVLRGAYVELDPRWNAQAVCMAPRIALPGITSAGRRWAAIRRLWRDDPWIVHYAGANKPWEPHQPATPRDDLWWSYAAASPMSEEIHETYRARSASPRPLPAVLNASEGRSQSKGAGSR